MSLWIQSIAAFLLFAFTAASIKGIVMTAALCGAISIIYRYLQKVCKKVHEMQKGKMDK